MEESQDFGAVMSAAVAWKCHCTTQCSPSVSARCLYNRTLEALSAGKDNAALFADLLGPLGMVVAGQKSAHGHGLCQDYIASLESGDHAAALDACQRLIELSEEGQTRGWDELPGRI